MLTINLRLNGRLVFLAGAGRVGLRKLKKIVLSGAKVKVLEPYASAELLEFVQGASVELYEHFQPEMLQGCSLVFIASSNLSLNKTIIKEARRLGLPLNIADNPDESDFFLPATIEHKDFCLSVSTGGGSPALSAYIASQLRASYGEEYGRLTALLSELRPLILNSGLPLEQREVICKALASSQELFLAVKDDDKKKTNSILKALLAPITYNMPV